jgi:hypothetical protein
MHIVIETIDLIRFMSSTVMVRKKLCALQHSHVSTALESLAD